MPPRGLNGRTLSNMGGRASSRGPVVSERNLPPEEAAFLGRIFAGRQISGSGFSSGGGPAPAYPTTSLVSPPGTVAADEFAGFTTTGAASVPVSVPPSAAALIQRNLRQLQVAAQRYFASAPDNEVTTARLMAEPANPQLGGLAVLAGEDYRSLVIKRAATSLSILTAKGGVVTIQAGQAGEWISW
jgi:hypothetical protein